MPAGPVHYRRPARHGAARLPDAPGLPGAPGSRERGEIQPASSEVHRGVGLSSEPASRPGDETTATPVAPLSARAEPAAPGLRPQPRRGKRQQEPTGPRPGHADPVGWAQPHGAVFQPAGSLATARPRGDGRGTGQGLGRRPALGLPASLEVPPGRRQPVRPQEAAGSLPLRDRPAFLSACLDGHVRAPRGRAAAPADHDLVPGQRQPRSVRRRCPHPARLPIPCRSAERFPSRGRRRPGGRGVDGASLRGLAAAVPALFPRVAGEPGVPGVGAAGGHVHFPGLPGQDLAAHRHAGRTTPWTTWSPGSSAR